MTREEKEIALYCLKANSDYHSEVCEECVKYPNCDHTIQDDVTESIIKALEQEPKWIPVSERLPKESFNSVIGWDACRERCVFVQYINGHFQITGKNESFNIKAWMPLPEPYKAESDSEQQK